MRKYLMKSFERPKKIVATDGRYTLAQELFLENVDNKPAFEAMFENLSQAIHECAKEKGWWDDGDRHPAEVLLNIIAEIVEAWEGAS